MAVPAATPVTIPEPVPTVAIPLLLLLHVPLLVASLSVVVAPAHTILDPVIGVIALAVKLRENTSNAKKK